MPSMQHTSLNTCQILSYDTVLQGIPRASESQTHALLARVLQAVAHHSEFSKARVSEEACEVRCAGHSSVHRCVQQNYLGMTYLQPQHRRKNNSNDNTMLAIEESRKRMKEDERRWKKMKEDERMSVPSTMIFAALSKMPQTTALSRITLYTVIIQSVS